MALSRELTVNGARVSVQIDDPDTPLLYVCATHSSCMGRASAVAFLSAVPARCTSTARPCAPA